MKKMLSLGLLLALCACNNVEVKKDVPITELQDAPYKFYSKEIKDTFYISVWSPKQLKKGTRYPVVYLLDANLYFDPMAATFKRYSEVELLPEAILVGIGYKNFQTLDSLRDRDYTFPAAIPDYDMELSGNGQKFLSFIDNELIPHMDQKYPTDKSKRVLMGHSLGGYFTLFALQQHLKEQKDVFFSYIAASPSADYNHCCILKELEKTNNEKLTPRCYVTYGGLEDMEEPGDTSEIRCAAVIHKLNDIFKKDHVVFKGDMYSELAHMHTSYPSFVKGLQLSFMSE